MSLVETVQSNFPTGVVVPKEISVLCDYLDEFGYPLSGCFEICTRGKLDVQGWFPGDEAMQRQIASFGRGSTGSNYALWLTKNADPNQAPVVVLGSEGDFKALATDIRSFCQLLGCGYSEVEWDDLSQPPEEWEETKQLRDYLLEKLKLKSPRVGEKIAAKAQEQYPDFRDWVRAWQKANLKRS